MLCTFNPAPQLSQIILSLYSSTTHLQQYPTARPFVQCRQQCFWQLYKKQWSIHVTQNLRMQPQQRMLNYFTYWWNHRAGILNGKDPAEAMQFSARPAAHVFHLLRQGLSTRGICSTSRRHCGICRHGPRPGQNRRSRHDGNLYNCN